MELDRPHPKCASGRIDDREYFSATKGYGTFCNASELATASRTKNASCSLANDSNSLYAGLILTGLPTVLTDNDDFLLSMNSAVLDNNAMHIDVHDSGDLEITLQDSRALRKIRQLIDAAMEWLQRKYSQDNVHKVSGKPVKRRKRRYTGAVNQSEHSSAQESPQVQMQLKQLKHLQGRQLERLSWMELKDVEKKLIDSLQRVKIQKRELVKNWKEDDVVKWLRFNETIYREYKDKFKAEGIDGEMLFDLTNEVLREDFGIKKTIHRKRIVDEISKLKREIAPSRHPSAGSSRSTTDSHMES